MNMNLSLQWPSSLVSHFSPSCLTLSCCFYTLVLFTYFDVRARLSISDFRLPSDRRTILFGRVPHLAKISSRRGVLIWMNIWEFLLSWTTLSNCPSANTLIPYWNSYRKCRKIWTWFPSSEIRKAGGSDLRITKSQACTSAEGGTNR